MISWVCKCPEKIAFYTKIPRIPHLRAPLSSSFPSIRLSEKGRLCASKARRLKEVWILCLWWRPNIYSQTWKGPNNLHISFRESLHVFFWSVDLNSLEETRGWWAWAVNIVSCTRSPCLEFPPNYMQLWAIGKRLIHELPVHSLALLVVSSGQTWRVFI